MDQVLGETGWRGSAEVWLEAAYELLLESGVSTVKILPLAKKLGLSRTSFYWFFKDREELLGALIARWRDKNTGNLVKHGLPDGSSPDLSPNSFRSAAARADGRASR